MHNAVAKSKHHISSFFGRLLMTCAADKRYTVPNLDESDTEDELRTFYHILIPHHCLVSTLNRVLE